MEIRVKRLSGNAVIPARAHEWDAGFDLVCTGVDEDRRHSCVVYHTGLAFEIPDGYVGLLFPRSSIYREDLALCNSVGVVDSGYRGEVMLRYRKLQPHIHRYSTGDRVGQIVFVRLPEVELSESDTLTSTDRGEGGFGSTGR